ncbi:hypothetical protein [Flavobacterium cerinum]|uniref:Uncharacterized protein n=1 Tax=Flavobacterium cerinum TaxID=2502784 RepID=A0ABY5IP16_9FLAO|nr:hypothetical protein [Flavobacterium cerinum]UUC44578.1 hypothetical protein NOX80_13160 [Flavobacterium cerinum]
MKPIVIVLFLILISCKNQDSKQIKEPTFLTIPENLQSGFDSLAKKITPDKQYQYWHYATYHQEYGSGKETYTIIAQGGDTLLRKSVNTKINPLETKGLFEGGHPGFRSNYLVVIEGGKIKYLDSMEQLRDFIGKIDNLEEALLFAKSYDYSIGIKSTGKVYYFKNNVFTLHLVHYQDYYFRPKGELVELTIITDGFIKTKSLGLYCQGRDCL